VVSEEELQATGLDERFLNTYRLAGTFSPSKAEIKKLAKKLKVVESTITRHLSRVRYRIEEGVPENLPKRAAGTGFEDIEPEKHAEMLSKLSEPCRQVATVAREVGVRPDMAYKIAKDLDGELQPLKRKIEAIRLEDLTNRFGTLARDAIDAITPEKIEKASAKDLGVLSGIAVDKWQLLRGQPTSRMEIGDRRQMNELLELLVKEAKRRGVEIDVTPEGGVTAKKPPYRNNFQRRMDKKIETGDPDETLAPA